MLKISFIRSNLDNFFTASSILSNENESSKDELLNQIMNFQINY